MRSFIGQTEHGILYQTVYRWLYHSFSHTGDGKRVKNRRWRAREEDMKNKETCGNNNNNNNRR